MNCALYVRVSTGKQDTNNKIAQLRAFAHSQGWVIVAEYADELTGKNSDRAQFQFMFKAASRREWGVLLFWSLDRLSREGALETLQHLNRLTNYGVQWRSLTEQYLDSTGMFRDAVISILAVVAKQERVRLSERTKAGLERARKQGKILGLAKGCSRCQRDPGTTRKRHVLGSDRTADWISQGDVPKGVWISGRLRSMAMFYTNRSLHSKTNEHQVGVVKVEQVSW